MSRFPLSCPSGAALVTALSILLSGIDVSAQTSQESSCRSAVANALVKYTTAVLKTTMKCHRNRSRGKVPLSVDCNDVAQADPANKLARQRASLTAAVLAGVCAQAPALLSGYPRCPSPAAASDDGEATDGIDSYGELASCLVGLVDGLAGGLSRETMGAPAAMPDVVARNCQSAIAKGVGKLVRTYGRERARCQADLDSQAQGPEYGCTGLDPRNKIAKARAKLLSSLDAHCGFADPLPGTEGNERLDSLSACGDTLEHLRTCVADVAVDRVASGLIAAAYELPATCRADRIVRTSYAGFGQRLTRTSLSAGWNGLGHGLDFSDGFSDVLALDCDPDCQSCALTMDAVMDEPLSFCRCAGNPTLSCDTINGPDPDDCAGLNNTCHCYFGPPLPTTAAGNPACVPIRIVGPYGGTVDLGTGEWRNAMKVVAAIHLGLDIAAPCPTCDGDVGANDGIRDGTCSSGARGGQPCDRNGAHPTFGGVSIDCQPQALTNISGGGLLLNFELLSEESSLPYTLPCDSAGQLCPCRVCAGDSTAGCRNDGECPAGTGPCTAGGGSGVQPNACNDRVCGADGSCAAGPVDKFCDGTVHSNGEGFVTCNSDFDCSLNGNGACTISRSRRCFPDPLVVDGSPGLFGADVGGLACIGLTTSAVINIASGLPGAVRVGLEFDAEPSCAGHPDTPWHPPGGSNCATTTSTTTTTLFPPLPCIASIPPACGGGDCPQGQECVSNGLTCACQVAATTTTTLPPAGCADQAFPLCAQGTCPQGSTCQLDLQGLACTCTPGTECADTFFPICGGSCPAGQSCQGDVLGLACACGP